MNVLFIGYADHRAAGMIHLHHFANELTELGQQVLALMPGDLSHAQTLRHPPRYAMESARFDGARLAADLLARVRAFAPDVVHAWTPRNLPARAGLVLSIACHAPLIIHYEDDEEELYHSLVGDVFTNRADFLDSWQHPDWQPHYYHPVFSAPACHLATGFTAICQPLIPRLEQQWVKPAHLLYPGVDLEQFADTLQPEAALLDSLNLRSKRVIVYSGPLNELHDFQLLIEAVAQLRAEFPDLVIVHVGRVFTPQLLDAPLERFGMREHVRFVGHVMHKDVPRYLALADVLVQTGKPGAYNESRLPSKLPEYMAMGKPIVTFSVGFGRLLEDGVEALKTHTDSAEELAQQLARLLRNPALCQRLGANARRKAAQLFNWRENTIGLLRWYAQMCEHARTQPAAAWRDVPHSEVSRARFALSKAPMPELRVNILVVGSAPRAARLAAALAQDAAAHSIYPAAFSVRRSDTLPAAFPNPERPSVIVLSEVVAPVVATEVASADMTTEVVTTPPVVATSVTSANMTTEVVTTPPVVATSVANADMTTKVVTTVSVGSVDAARYLARVCVWEAEGQELPAAPAHGYDFLLRGDADDPAALMRLVAEISNMAWQPKPLRAAAPLAEPNRAPIAVPAATAPPANAAAPVPRYRNRLSYLLAEAARNYEAGGWRLLAKHTLHFLRHQ
jgi:glycosyltransferase involved in cell wall biosynthesis